MGIEKYAKEVAGKKKTDILVFALSTCVWCQNTKRVLKEIGCSYKYIDVDLVPDKARDEVAKEFARWNKSQTFPTIVIDNKRSIIGFDEPAIRKLAR